MGTLKLLQVSKSDDELSYTIPCASWRKRCLLAVSASLFFLSCTLWLLIVPMGMHSCLISWRIYSTLSYQDLCWEAWVEMIETQRHRPATPQRWTSESWDWQNTSLERSKLTQQQTSKYVSHYCLCHLKRKEYILSKCEGSCAKIQ